MITVIKDIETTNKLPTNITTNIVWIKYTIFTNKQIKVQVYSLISSLKIYHPNLHFTPWSLDLFIRAISTTRRAYSV